jgi:hypothetical protein
MSIPLPSSQCKDVGTAAALRAAITGIATCLPDATEVQTLANSVSTCSSFYTIFLTWIAVVWKAICYVFANAAPPTPGHEGIPTFAIDPTMGGGATYTILPGSTDVQGGVVITLGSAPTAGGGPAGLLTFGTPFAAQIYPVTGAYPPISASHAFSTGWQLAPTQGPATTPVTDMTLTIGVDTADFIIEGDIFVISWHIGYTS